MRKITFPEKPEDAQFSAPDMCREILQNESQKGMTIEDMRVRLKILDKLDSATDTLLLEDAEWKAMTDAITRHRFPVAHPFILAAADAVLSAPTCDA